MPNQVFATFVNKFRSNFKKENWDKYAYTILICLNHFAYGVTCTTFGPAMVDMKYIFNTSMNWISLYPTFYSVGYLLGSLFGFLYKYLNRQITVIVLVVAMSVATAFIPHTPSLVLLFLCALVNGIGSGAWDNCLYVWLIEMWQHNSPPILQVTQFMFGAGTIVGPLLDQPYITGEPDDDEQANHSITTTMTSINSTIDDVDRRSLLKTPFAINGGIQVIIPMVLLAMFFIKKYEKILPQSIDENKIDITTNDDIKSTEIVQNTVNEAKNLRIKLIDRPESPTKLFICLVAFFLSSYLTLELAIFQFNATFYQYIPLRLSASKAAELMSIMATSYTVARGLSAFIAMKVKPQYMIIYHYCFIIIALVLLLIGQKTYTTLWAGNLIIGLGLSALWAGVFAFVEQYIEITNRVGAVFIFTCGFMPIFSPFILGPFIEQHPIVLIIFVAACLSINITLFILIFYIIKKYKKLIL